MAGLSYRHRVDAGLRSGDPQAVLDVAVAAYEASAGDLLAVWGGVVQYLGRQPAATREALLRTLPGRHACAPVGSGLRLGLLHLAAILGQGLPLDVLAAERRETILALGDRWAVKDHTRLYLVRTELATGRALPAEVVATVRRSAKLTSDPGWAALAAPLTNPLLNVGERWADEVLAELGVLGPDWQALVTHAGTVRSGRPTSGWDRVGGELLARLGEAEAHRRILSWLPLVGLERTLPLTGRVRGGPGGADGHLDPFNAGFLRGLVLMLSLTGSVEETVPALGRLVDTCLYTASRQVGPRSAKVANAAVAALGRFGSSAATAELRRLAGRATYGTTRRLIDRRLLRTR
ncbi:hypothetical protein [Streptomyces sp. NPDC001068]|uniref:hypothetical protein n=1 Tax=Streptomyces sp. NPDC001068 TaxID=3364544 RepID=UPI0036C31311